MLLSAAAPSPSNVKRTIFTRYRITPTLRSRRTVGLSLIILSSQPVQKRRPHAYSSCLSACKESAPIVSKPCSPRGSVARAARLRRHSHPAEYLPTQSKWPGLRWIWKRGTEKLWLQQVRKAGASEEQIEGALFRMREDRCASLEDQLDWLRAAGFAVPTAGIRRTALPSLQAAGSLRSIGVRGPRIWNNNADFSNFPLFGKLPCRLLRDSLKVPSDVNMQCFFVLGRYHFHASGQPAALCSSSGPPRSLPSSPSPERIGARSFQRTAACW